MKNVTVLGSTGSIGRQALDVISMHPDLFRLRGLGAHASTELFREQLNKYRPPLASFSVPFTGTGETVLYTGTDAAEKLAADPETDIVVLGISGFAALRPLLAALKAGKRVALANKESIVCGGKLVKEALRAGGELLPVDSEQSAIFQCLQNGRREEVSKLILTASGGPFRLKKREELTNITPAQAVAHPTWSMGRKISLDSATMFNKGLEVMEAAGLFDFPGEKIEVLLHPQSVVHSMVEYRDGTVMADMGPTDMRLAIQYAMTFPERLPSPAGQIDWRQTGPLEFFKPSFERFPALEMAYECLRLGRCYPAVYNGANEQAASLFFAGRIRFTEIEECVRCALDAFAGMDDTAWESVLAADTFAREQVRLWEQNKA